MIIKGYSTLSRFSELELYDQKQFRVILRTPSFFCSEVGWGYTSMQGIQSVYFKSQWLDRNVFGFIIWIFTKYRKVNIKSYNTHNKYLAIQKLTQKLKISLVRERFFNNNALILISFIKNLLLQIRINISGIVF